MIYFNQIYLWKKCFICWVIFQMLHNVGQLCGTSHMLGCTYIGCLNDWTRISDLFHSTYVTYLALSHIPDEDGVVKCSNWVCTSYFDIVIKTVPITLFFPSPLTKIITMVCSISSGRNKA